MLMARVDMRTAVNKTGVTYDASQTTILYAEDHEKIKDAIDDGTAGINTEQVEIGGTEAITKDGDSIIFGDTSSGNYIKVDTTNNKIEVYVDNQKVIEWG